MHICDIYIYRPTYIITYIYVHKHHTLRDPCLCMFVYLYVRESGGDVVLFTSSLRSDKNGRTVISV